MDLKLNLVLTSKNTNAPAGSIAKNSSQLFFERSTLRENGNLLKACSNHEISGQVRDDKTKNGILCLILAVTQQCIVLFSIIDN